MKSILVFFIAWLLISNNIAAQDPDIQDDDTLSGLDRVVRTSDWDGKRATGRRVKRVSVPRGALRLGCVCMDDSQSPARSIGACSGHGGVRYWLYRTVEGDTVRVQTGRHEQHPGALDVAERSALAQQRAERTARLTQGLTPVVYGPPAVMLLPGNGVAPTAFAPPDAPNVDDDDGFLDWPDVAGIGVFGTALVVSVRLLLRWVVHNPELARDALRNLLRHRRRRVARKNRAPARKPRL